MNTKDRILRIKASVWLSISIILISIAFFLFELTEIIPFSGTIITLYAVTIVLFSIAMYARGKISRYKIFRK